MGNNAYEIYDLSFVITNAQLVSASALS